MEATSSGPTLLGLPLCSPGFGHKIRLLETVVVFMGLLEFWPPHEESQNMSPNGEAPEGGWGGNEAMKIVVHWSTQS